ncbi:UNVERIFIED_CONTAM: hypothetical protein HDU68_000323 [Siphonaria sp. JEL0065]|nr:hypothetical protein HDU68_000323 [Siphonaria sp. JEL0065]
MFQAFLLVGSCLVGWYYRRSVPGIIIFALFVALPLQFIKRLLGHTAVLDTYAATLLETMTFVSKNKDVTAIARLSAQTTDMERRKIEKNGGTSSFVTENGVSGLWLVEDKDDIPVRRIDVGSSASRSNVIVLLFMHGGGYGMGTCYQGISVHLSICKRFNALERQKGSQKRLALFSVEYKLAPEAKFPSQLHECINAFEYLNEHYHIDGLAVGGDSSGGHAIIHFLNAIKTRPDLVKLPLQPSATILISPWVDPYLHHAPEPLPLDMFSLEGTRNFSEAAFGETRKTQDFFFTPKGTFIVYGSAEILHISLGLFVDLLKELECPNLNVLVAEGMPHTYQFLNDFPSVKPHAEKAVDSLVMFLQECFSMNEE